MKKILTILLAVAGFFYLNGTIELVNFDLTRKEALMEIASQDLYALTGGGLLAVNQGRETVESFEIKAKKAIEDSFNCKSRITKVLIVDSVVAGFIVIYKGKELSVEAIKQNLNEEQLTMFDENLVLAANAYLKKTDAECKRYVKIERIAIAKDFRRRGYARVLIKGAMIMGKRIWPDIELARICVNLDNSCAIKLYESEGFVLSAIQPSNLAQDDVLQYEKILS